jgi:hypothetical protein
MTIPRAKRRNCFLRGPSRFSFFLSVKNGPVKPATTHPPQHRP